MIKSNQIRHLFNEKQEKIELNKLVEPLPLNSWTQEKWLNWFYLVRSLITVYIIWSQINLQQKLFNSLHLSITIHIIDVDNRCKHFRISAYLN